MAERYVSALAVGGGTGSAAQPWTFAEMLTAIQGGAVANGDRCNVKADGVYTQPDFSITRNAASGIPGYITVEGYTTTIGDGGRPTIQRTGGEVGTWWAWTGNYYIFRSLILDGNNVGNATGYGLQSDAYNLHINVEIKNSNTLWAATLGRWLNCYIHDSLRGFTGAGTMNCIVADCTVSVGFYGGFHRFSIAKGNQGNGFEAGWFVNCIADGNQGHGFSVGAQIPILNCVAMNAPVGSRGVFGGGAIYIVNCNFWNNDVDYNVANNHAFNSSFVDPQFNDPANLDYTRTGSNLDDLGFSSVGLQSPIYGVDIGVDQRRTCTLPAESEVEKGVAFVDHGVAKTGTLEAVTVEYPLDVVVDDEGLVVETSGEEVEVEVSV